MINIIKPSLDLQNSGRNKFEKLPRIQKAQNRTKPYLLTGCSLRKAVESPKL